MADDGMTCRCAATPMWETSARLPLPTDISSSISTTLTNRCPARGNGTSSGWRRAWCWPDGSRAKASRAAATPSAASSREYRTAMALFADLSVFELAKYEIRRRSQIPSRASGPCPGRAGDARTSAGKADGEKRRPSPLPFRTPSFAARFPARSRGRWSPRFASTAKRLAPIANSSSTPIGRLPWRSRWPGRGAWPCGITSFCAWAARSTTRSFMQVKQAQEACAAPYLANMSVPANQGPASCRRPTSHADGLRPALGLDGDRRAPLSRPPVGRPQGADRRDAASQGDTLSEYASVCGRVLAKGHARTGDPLALTAYCGRADKLDRAIATVRVRLRRSNDAGPRTAPSRHPPAARESDPERVSGEW